MKIISKNYDLFHSYSREQGVEEPAWRWDGGFVIVTFKRPTRNMAPKETKELTKEIIEVINNRDLTEVQINLLSLIIAMPSITLTKMAEELNMTIEQVRTLREKMENKGVFLCCSFTTKNFLIPHPSVHGLW